jgi:hypothetical protein
MGKSRELVSLRNPKILLFVLNHEGSVMMEWLPMLSAASSQI